jgi:hypothetical protein
MMPRERERERERERDAVEDAGRLLFLPERFPVSAVIETQILSCSTPLQRRKEWEGDVR